MPAAEPPKPAIRLHKLRCERCDAILFEHERPAGALGVLRLKCGSRNYMNVLLRPQ